MACGTCRQLRSDLARAVIRGDVKGAVETAKQALEHLQRPPPATAQFSRKR